jgi:hypothetical protein
MGFSGHPHESLSKVVRAAEGDVICFPTFSSTSSTPFHLYLRIERVVVAPLLFKRQYSALLLAFLPSILLASVGAYMAMHRRPLSAPPGLARPPSCSHYPSLQPVISRQRTARLSFSTFLNNSPRTLESRSLQRSFLGSHRTAKPQLSRLVIGQLLIFSYSIVIDMVCQGIFSAWCQMVQVHPGWELHSAVIMYEQKHFHTHEKEESLLVYQLPVAVSRTVER